MAVVLSLAAWLLIPGVVYAAARNDRVYAYRMRLLALIGDAADDDIAAGRPWEWRYAALDRVPYSRMVYSIRSFDSFYPDKRFITMGAQP